MKGFAARVALAAALWCGPVAGASQIVDTIYTGFPSVRFYGVCTIYAPEMTTADGRALRPWQRDVRVTAGVLSVTLEPNDAGALAGTTYTVVCQPAVGKAWTEWWSVPTSAGPLKIGDVRTGSSSAPRAGFNYRLVGGLAKGDWLYGDAAGLAARLAAPEDGTYGIRWTNGVPSYVLGGAGGGGVATVFGRTGAVTAQAGDYTTDQVSEGSKLYFTDARALAAVPNFTGDSGAGGVRGTVPAPAAGDAAANKFLKADGRWVAAPAVAATTCIDTAGLGWFAPLGANPGTAMGLSPNMGAANGGGFFQFVVPCTMTVSKALFNVTTAQGAVCDTGSASPCGFVIAIYNAAGNLVGQTTSIYSGGTPDLSTTGAKAATFTAPVTLAPGVYWMSLTGDGTALRLAGDANSYGLILNADSTTRIGFGGGASTGHGSSLTAAGTKPSLAAKSDSFSQLPSIYLVR